MDCVEIMEFGQFHYLVRTSDGPPQLVDKCDLHQIMFNIALDSE
jgi:hypothetical protein